MAITESKTNLLGVLIPSTESAQRIVVIDDNAALTMSMLLELAGYKTYSQPGGWEGIKATEALRPAVILCDISMPGMDGYETANLPLPIDTKTKLVPTSTGLFYHVVTLSIL